MHRPSDPTDEDNLGLWEAAFTSVHASLTLDTLSCVGQTRPLSNQK